MFERPLSWLPIGWGSKSSTPRLAFVAWVVVALAVGCSGTATISETGSTGVGSAASDATTSDESAPIVEPTAEPLQIGLVVEDYANVPDGACAVFVGGEYAAEVVSCDAPHEFQKYGVAENPPGVYPGTDVLLASCYPYFLDFAGTPIGESGLWGEGWYPTEIDWAAGDHGVECLIFFESPVSGSLPTLDLAAGFDGRIPWSSVTAETCVANVWDIDNVAVQTADCDDDLGIDVLGLVVDGATSAEQSCDELADDAGYPAGFIERSSLLVVRGYDSSICYAEMPTTSVSG